MDWSDACSKMTAGQWFHDLFRSLAEFELEFSSEIMGEQAPADYLERYSRVGDERVVVRVECRCRAYWYRTRENAEITSVRENGRNQMGVFR